MRPLSDRERVLIDRVLEPPSVAERLVGRAPERAAAFAELASLGNAAVIPSVISCTLSADRALARAAAGAVHSLLERTSDEVLLDLEASSRSTSIVYGAKPDDGW